MLMLVIFVLLVFATALLIAAVAFLVMLIALNRRMGRIERQGIEVNSLTISRDQKAVYLNDFEFKLTDAAIETLSVLAEARLELAQPHAIVMHPGPMNREVEIAGSVADSPCSVITEQVTNGVAVRMAVMQTVMETLHG